MRSDSSTSPTLERLKLLSKFNVGDRVRYVSNGPTGGSLPGYKFGDEFTVTGVHHWEEAVFLNPSVLNANGRYSWRDEHFELVTEPETEWVTVKVSELKVNDTVKTPWGEWTVNTAGSHSVRISKGGESKSFAWVGKEMEIEVKRPKPLELPTEPMVPFWGLVYRDGQTYEGVLMKDPIASHLFISAQGVGSTGGQAHDPGMVTRLPWPAGELEKFKAGLK